MKMNDFVNEIEVVKCEYVIAAYVHGRYEIEVYSHVSDALDAINYHREKSTCIDEIRLEINAKWFGNTASVYRSVVKDASRLKQIEPELKAWLMLSLAHYFAGLNHKKMTAF